MSPTDIVARAVDVTRRYRLGDEDVWALKGVSLDVRRGEFLSIMGPSGSGKSTLFNMIGALDIPTSGTIQFMGEDLFKLPEEKQAWLRCNKIGYIFQTYNLIQVMTALENVALPMVFKGASRKEARDRAAAVLEIVGLGNRTHHLPAQLSGGQQQRVAIARALVNSPALILADEPTGNLDSRTSIEIMGVFQKLNDDGITLVMVTHELDIARYTKRNVVMRDGKIVTDEVVKQRLFAAEELAKLKQEHEAVQLA